MRSWLQGLLLTGILMVSGQIAAAVMVTVEGRDADFAARFAGALSELLPDRVELVPPGQAELRVALDPESFQQALASGDFVIGVDIPRDLARSARKSGCRCTAFLAGADPNRQLRLIRKLLPSSGRVGVLVGPESADIGGELTTEGVEPPLKLDIKFVDGPESIGPALNTLLPRVDVLLAIQDPGLYNATTAKLVLLTSYRQDVPVIGPNAEFVRAGSLATTYSSGFDLVNAVADVLRHFSKEQALPPPAYPDYFSVTINEHVARAYDLVVRDPHWLQSQLQAGEAP